MLTILETEGYLSSFIVHDAENFFHALWRTMAIYNIWLLYETVFMALVPSSFCSIAVAFHGLWILMTPGRSIFFRI